MDREDVGIRDRIFKLKKEIKESIQIFVRNALSNKLLNGSIITVRKVLENKKVAFSNNRNSNVRFFFEILKSEFDKGILYEISVKRTGYQNQIIKYYPFK